MNTVHLGQIDLNLLRVFDALAEEGSATGAGRRLRISQSAVSHALRRLRDLFGDPLFIRGPNGMRPTARAAEIAPALRDALNHLQVAISPGAFSPDQTDRRFTIAAGSYPTSVLLPAVVERIRAAAPLADVRIQALESDLEQSLRNGVVDVAIGVIIETSDRLDREHLFEDEAVWAMRAGHPAANGRFTLKKLAAVAHIAVTSRLDNDGAGPVVDRSRRLNLLEGAAGVDEVLAQAGLKRRVPMAVHDIYGALAIASRTDMAVLAPRRMAEVHAKALGLTLLDPPYPSRSVSVESVWNADASGHPALQWLRQVIRDAASAISRDARG